MPNRKISELVPVDAFSGAERIEIIQAGENKKITPNDIPTSVGDALNFIAGWPTSNAFPTTGGSWAGGFPAVGDMWVVTNSDGLTVGGNTYPLGTIIMAIVDIPGQALTNWVKFAMIADEGAGDVQLGFDYDFDFDL